MTASSTIVDQLRRQRDALRARGLRPVRFWLPDTRSAVVRAECARQAKLIRDAETALHAAEDAENEAWFDTSDRTGWTA